ncbi:MAG: bifunctional (p)ppGpp synthetase/guanosine-3',5'-bis(diphosphate) 3'-pyrophosphohydrolase [Chitinispirillia bacterium]|nr:bifunctional (p)ppGpp synthetase/guanosine-3',5'-bis(diphosphate) 3'-pyrophosphohydrolase [Chitinispirillia bacterium]MCL2269397.1 bifunctional (p)ppGpp synthetase/guanosine-3',5'-bis(diphosphate) 3'-pyrophosphohydrolase [Chitinispirillia bacterium]
MESILNTLPASTPEVAVKQFLDKILEVNPGVDAELIGRAYLFASEAHKDQRRKSGELYFIHPVCTAVILAEQKLDSVTIAAGLLHDVLEDTSTTKDDLVRHFGEDVALLVDGVTKIKALQMKTREDRQAETYRKMLLSMAKDLRVIIIKFADRVHNLRTLKYLDPEKIKQIATETLDIYSPLALRLGMGKIKWELDDLAFKHLYPEAYKDIVSKVVASRVDRESVIDAFAGPLRSRLEHEGINATIAGRPKHFYSIYNKMQKRGKPFEEIYDNLAIRIIVDTVKDCYCVLGIIHSMWMPVQERFKDYIGAPKNNGYRSLHTTVVGTQGSIVEIQIRTWEMNKTAEEGIAAHWLYKEGAAPPSKEANTDDKAIAWLKNVIEWQENLTDSAEFYEFFKVDLFDAEIFVFTPKGNLISMPKGATVLDFAFAVHTDIGIHCIGAKIDGHVEPVNAELKSGQTIEILHLNSKTPSADMMRYVKTPKARSAIRHWLNNAEKQESIDLGKKIIQRAYEKLHANSDFSDHASELLQHLGLINIERLYEQVGRGELTESRVMNYFQDRKIKRNVPSMMMSQFMKNLTGQRPQGILVGGRSNLMVRFAQCCNPIPGDRIIGFLTKGRGISVHRTDCRHTGIFEDDRERSMEVSWADGEQKKYYVTLKITGADRSGLLTDVSAVFMNFGASVANGNIKGAGDRCDLAFQIEIRNLNQLKQISRQIEKIKGIEKVERVKDYIMDYHEFPRDGAA